MACTEAQRAANRENAKKSTGPVTAEGKARSRRNAIKHGLSGAGEVLTPELSQLVEAARREFEDVLRPADAYERRLVEEIALASARMRIAPDLEGAATEVNRLRDLENFDSDRDLQAVKIGAKLPRRPNLARAELMRFSAGCEWLRDRWLALDAALDGDSPSWSKEQLTFSLDLLGIPLEERHLAAKARRLAEQCRLISAGDAAALAALRDFIAAEVATLEAEADRLATGIEQYDYNNLATRSRFDFSREVQSLRRLELDASRRFHRNLRILEVRRGGRLWAAPSAATPATPPTPPPPRPEPVPEPAAAAEPRRAAVAPPPERPAAGTIRRDSAANRPRPNLKGVAKLERLLGLDAPPPVLDRILR